MLFDVKDNIARITINREHSFNSINGQAAVDLHDIVNLIAGDKDVRAVVIAGSGDKAFCAGGVLVSFTQISID